MIRNKERWSKAGVKQLAESILKVLDEHKVQTIPHDSIFLKIDEAAKLFNVLIIKKIDTIQFGISGARLCLLE